MQLAVVGHVNRSLSPASDELPERKTTKAAERAFRRPKSVSERYMRSAERPITVGRQSGDFFEQRAKELRGRKSQLLGDRTDGRFRSQKSLPGYLHTLELDVCVRPLARFVLYHVREVCGR